jgi:hypothetical protein
VSLSPFLELCFLFVSGKLRWAALKCGVVTGLQAGPALIFRGGATYVESEQFAQCGFCDWGEANVSRREKMLD